MTIDEFKTLMPMKYYDNPEPAEGTSAAQKRKDIIQNVNNLYIGSEKHDGDWSMCIHYTKGQNLIRSRSISKVTGEYGDYTAKLPHLTAEMNTWPDNTVVLAEICWNEYGTNANTVGTILRCLPAKAIERQKEKKLYGLVFDLLMFNGEDLTQVPYEQRLRRAQDYFNLGHQDGRAATGNFFHTTAIFTDNFAEHADEIIEAGGEGLVLQLRNNPYMPGTRSAWKTLKLKQCLPHQDLQVVATLPASRDYNGIEGDTWQYWERRENGVLKKVWVREGGRPSPDAYPITKPYYFGWPGAIRVKYKDTTTDVASGLTDEDRAWLTTAEAQEQIAAGGLWAEVKAMSENDKGALRHPVLVRLRNDM